MNYALIRENDIANGPGVRTTLFVSGCRHHCRSCFNPEAWDFSYGSPFGQDEIDRIISACSQEHISGLTLLGGEPLEPENRGALAELLRQFRQNFSEKSVWCYTGFVFETELLPAILDGDSTLTELLQNVDVLVDGRFVEELKSYALIFRGSSNQNIIDMRASLAEGRQVLLDGVWERRGGEI